MTGYLETYNAVFEYGECPDKAPGRANPGPWLAVPTFVLLGIEKKYVIYHLPHFCILGNLKLLLRIFPKKSPEPVRA